MNLQSVQHTTEYNSLIEDVFGKLKFTQFRNNADLLWVKQGAKMLKVAVDKLLKVAEWTSNEKRFLERTNELIVSKLEKTMIVRITNKQAGEILGLSIEAMAERDILVQDEILENGRGREFRDALFLLEANVRLLRLIKNKLKEREIDEKDFSNVKDISVSLIKSYGFILGEIKNSSYLKESLMSMRGIWRSYNSLESITVA
ncbi:MAG: hypothetical protein OEL87_00040 [Nanoarchaeota archaeon]|nr:hypothetical protein [Nanoarchaeota archaeon]